MYSSDVLSIEKVDTYEVKEKIIEEVVESLTRYYAPLSANLSFPELILPTQIVLERFKQNVSHKKQVQHLLDVIQRNIDYVAAQRAKIADKSFKDPARLLQQLSTDIQSTPLSKEVLRLSP